MAELIDLEGARGYVQTFIADPVLKMAANAVLNNAPRVEAVDVKQYETLLEMYNQLRENFVDYVCSGVTNVAPYCLNRCEECVDGYGWCKHNDKCHGFNPAECIIDGERKVEDG